MADTGSALKVALGRGSGGMHVPAYPRTARLGAADGPNALPALPPSGGVLRPLGP